MRTVTRATTRELACFLAGLRFAALPRPVVERTKDLFLDWIASALGQDILSEAKAAE